MTTHTFQKSVKTEIAEFMMPKEYTNRTKMGCYPDNPWRPNLALSPQETMFVIFATTMNNI